MTKFASLYRWIGVLLLLGAVAGTTVALDPARPLGLYVLDTWGTESGLPHDSVLSILQTPDGYLWLGTFEGLARFDGVSFTVFDKSTTDAFVRNVVLTLAPDGTGGLYAGTGGGGLLHYSQGRFQHLGREDGLPDESVTALYHDTSDRLWIGTRSGMVCLENGRIHPVKAGGLDTAFVHDILADKDGALWVATAGSGLVRLADGRVSVFNTSNGFPHNTVWCLYYSWQTGDLWAGTRGGGLARLRNGHWTVFTQKDGLSGDDITCLYEDREGNLWIGTDRGGLNRYEHGVFSALTRRQGLTDDFVSALLEDVEGSLWIGTYRGGLDRLRDGKLVTYNTVQGICSDQVRTVLPATGKGVWIGTMGGGLSYLGPDRVGCISTAQGLSDDRVVSLCTGTDGDLWVGTYAGGLDLVRHNRVEKIYNTGNGLAHNRVRTLCRTRDGDLWIGTDGGGIDVLHQGVLHHYDRDSGLPGVFVYAIHEDHQGTIWIGTQDGGLCRWQSGRFARVIDPAVPADIVVWSFCETSDGTLWMGTAGDGVLRWKDDRFRLFSSRDGLWNDVVFQVVADSAGDLWMGSNKGLFRVKPKDVTAFEDGTLDRLPCQVFGRSDGMPVQACNGPASPAGCRGADGKLWFPTAKGLVMVDPAHLGRNTHIPPVVIERLLVNGKAVPLNGPVILPPGSTKLEFHYAGLSLLVPDKVRFRYMLEGFDTEWDNPGTRRTAYYSNLPPGRYTFRVLAANNDGVWNKTGASLSIVLKPFFYQTWMFYLLLGGGVFLLGYSLVLVRVHSLKRRKIELERQVTDRTRQLADANRELERLARFDGLTGIANYRAFSDFFVREWRRCLRDGKPISLILIDVDHFKRYNDRYGHQAGDDVLRRIAAVFATTANRPGDLAARYGGEEFVVVLSDTRRDGAVHVAELLRKGVEILEIPHENNPGHHQVTISLGVASATPTRMSDDPFDQVKKADVALYEAKESGRNQMKLATDD